MCNSVRDLLAVCALIAVAILSQTVCEFGGANLAIAEDDDFQSSLSAWIHDLDHPAFARREEATRRLVDSRRFAIEPLETPAIGGSAERRWRTVYILRKLCLVRDRETSRLALASLRRLAASYEPSFASRPRIAIREYESRRHERAVAEIIAMGGSVTSRAGPTMVVRLDDKWQGGDQDLALLSDLNGNVNLSITGLEISDDGLRHIGQISDLRTLEMVSCRVPGPSIAHLKTLYRLTVLSLRNTPIRDIDVAHLAGLTQLKRLGFDGTHVGDDALHQLRMLNGLRELWLNGCRVTDQGLVHLKAFPKLERLDLSRTKVTGSELTQLEHLTELRVISLQYAPIRDDALAPLGKLTKLTSLGLDDTLITDAGLWRLAPLANLQILWLTNTKLTDAGLRELRRHRKLTTLAIKGTKVTQEGVRQFKLALPRCSVTHDADLAVRPSPPEGRSKKLEDDPPPTKN